MLAGILSDIHDNLPNLERALSELRSRDVETLCFLGDFCSPIPARLLAAYGGDVHCVFGNGDGDRFAIRGITPPNGGSFVLHGEWAELELDGLAVALTHYPFYARALARTGDYAAVFSGHTHERHHERLGKTLWLNPGEILGWKGAPSCALWDTRRDAVEFLELA